MNAATRIDFASLASLALSQSGDLLARWFPAGKLKGHEYKVGNLRGEPGDSLSINVSTGAWSDFAADVRGGDLINLLAARDGITQGEAARRIAVELGQPGSPGPGPSPGKVVPLKPVAAVAPKWEPILPVPPDAPPLPAAHPKHGSPVHVARYVDAAGALLMFVHRFEPSGERKQVIPATYCQSPSGAKEWRWLSVPAPRPLYGLDLLNASPDLPVLVVEGEPKCDAARLLLDGAFVVVAWPNGAAAVDKADWSPLAERDVVIWPDADGPGLTAASEIVIAVRHRGGTARVARPPSDKPSGWDVGDAVREGWTRAKALSFLVEPATAAPKQEAPERPGEHNIGQLPYTPLGHDRGRFYFHCSAGGQVRDFSARDLQNTGALVEIAPLMYWEMEFPAKSGPDVRAAGAHLVAACHRVGIFDPERLRGRGAWLDNGQTVLHLGDRVWTASGERDPAEVSRHHLYERAARLDLPVGVEPLSANRAKQLVDLCKAAPWENPDMMGRLLAGWLVIAPVCGAMPWRPHLWITSEKGGGKSWVMDNLVRPLVGSIALRVASKTSEPALRAALRLDARPVLFDEFESQNDADRARVQQVLDLARLASSEDGADVLKGVEFGKGVSRYRPRSCFAFSSINLGLSQAADESRTVALTLSPLADPEKRVQAFGALKALHAKVLTPDFVPALLARTLRLLPIIRENAEVFAQAIARSGAPRRTGDTLGVLLAGTWSLGSSQVATPEEADGMVAGKAWIREAVGQANTEPEYQRALDFLMQQPLRVNRSNGRPEDVSIGELLAVMAGCGDKALNVTPPLAVTTLARAGLRVESDPDPEHGWRVLVANTGETIRQAFSTTPWATGWLATLARVPGAFRTDKAFKFAGHTSRALSLPLSAIVDGEIS